MDNIENIKAIQNLLETNTPCKISVLGAASPDGPFSLNDRLARERAVSAVAALKAMCPGLSDSLFIVNTISEDIEGTISYIQKSGEPWAEEAIALLRKGGKDPEEALRHFKGGIVWRYLADKVYPQLRRSEISFTFIGVAANSGSASGLTGVEGAENQENTPLAQGNTPAVAESGAGNKVPGWAIGVMSVLAAAAAGFGILYARERKRNRNLMSQGPSSPEAPAISPEEPAVSPDIPASAIDTPAIQGPVAPAAPEASEIAQNSPVIAPEAPAALSTAPEAPSFLDNIKGIIQDNISDPGFGVEELAAKVGISRIHLNRKLKAEADSSPSALLKEARMGLAASLLKEGKLSIAEISSRSGFSTPSYFATAFKDYYNISPSEFTSQS